VFIVLALIYIPLIIIVLLSFNGQTLRGNINLNFGVPSVVNYINLFSDDDFLNALFNSLIIGAIVTPVTIIIATITCFGIWRSKPFRTKSVLLASNLTIVNPEAITGVSLFLLFSAT
jgi:spermidine/putrescine transport system permease protein